jgi:cyanophycinase
VVQNSVGPLLAIGGAEDKSRDRVILNRFLDLSGNGTARIAIIPTASSLTNAGDRYRAVFRDLGANQIEVLEITDRATADDKGIAEVITQSTGVFMTGGNQVRLASIIGGTRVAASLEQQHQKGLTVAGTSAGASVMSTVMVAGGHSGPTPRRAMVQMSRGLGLIDSVIIDQHFTERNRVSRLVAMVSYNPGLLGIGIDEDTAALIQPEGVIEVIGRGSVLIVDGSGMETDIYKKRGKAPPTIANAVIHFVAEGGRYDLDERAVIPED